MTTPPDFESLFDAAETLQLSPRLAWMKKHNIQVASDVVDTKGKPWGFIAYVPNEGSAYSDTEDKALSLLASYMGIKMWNEPGYQP